MIRDYLRRMFAPRPSPSLEDSSEMCVHVHQHHALLDRLKVLDEKNADLARRLEAVGYRCDAAEARATEYGKRLAELRRLAVPVSIMLIEGDIEAASAANAMLWESLKPEVGES